MARFSSNLTEVTDSAERRRVPLARRELAPIATFDARWLVGVVVLVPIALTAGVYWLHHMPEGSQRFASAAPVVEVRLVQELAPEPAPLITLRPDAPVEQSRAEPMVLSKTPTISEETSKQVVAPAAMPAQPGLDKGATPAAARQRSAPSGSATAFQRQLLSHIARFRRYPPDAQPGELRGVVQVRFAMRRDGTVTETWVRTSSGHVLLDQAATETVRRAQPLPSIPADLPDTLTILLPISFDAP